MEEIMNYFFSNFLVLYETNGWMEGGEEAQENVLKDSSQGWRVIVHSKGIQQSTLSWSKNVNFP